MQSQTNKIGLYGGSFDPIHFGHLALIETAIEKLHLEKAIIMPSGGIAHYKPDSNKASGIDRVEMIQRAIGDHTQIEVSSFETDQHKFVYTIDTLRHLKTCYPNHDIILLVGGDWITRIPTWKDGDKILHDFQVAAFSRPGFEHQGKDKQHENVHYIEMPMLNISSSEIRNKIANHEDVSHEIPQAVWEYIQAKQLYHKEA